MRAVHPIPAPENVTIPVPAKEVPVTGGKPPKQAKAKTGKKDAHLKVPTQARDAQRRNARQMPTRRMNNRGGR